MTSRSRLQATMEALSRKRQKEFDEFSKWNDRIQYYKNWDRHNNQYQSWTSSDYYATSLNQYDAMKLEKQKSEKLEQRREKLRKLYFEEEQEYDLELTQSPRSRLQARNREPQTSTKVLKDVNLGLKLAEEDRKRHEAELNLYHQWRNENPIIRNFQSNQNKADLKLAWLDQQIEKRMAQEKSEEEIRKMIQERDRLVKEDEELERLELDQQAKRQQDLMAQIDCQMKQFNLKEAEAEVIEKNEAKARLKQIELDQLMEKQREDMRRREREDVALFNLNQSKIKLRTKATNVMHQLQEQQRLVEDLLASKVWEEIDQETKRNQTQSAISSFLNYLRDQQHLEKQRHNYISSIFDSEAKHVWEKQERLWHNEQNARDKLLTDILAEIKTQIADKLNQNVERQRALIQEREAMLKSIEETNNAMRLDKEKAEERKLERRLELDKQITDKRLTEQQQEFEEEKKRKVELEAIRKEEERLKYELMKMQTQRYPQYKMNRRIVW